jgi:DNA-binding NarL/FixJ family response regulator
MGGWPRRPDAVIADFGSRGAADVAGDVPTPEDPSLTPRERDVLRLLAQGWSDKEIAAELGMGRRTVSTHVAAIRAKLKAASRSAAAAIAARDRLM